MTDVIVSSPSSLFNVVNFRKENIRIAFSGRQSDTGKRALGNIRAGWCCIDLP